MRIAQDVINRIKYDPDLPTEAFVVGYEDRFVGIKEKSFTAFKWEDLAMVDDRAGDLASHSTASSILNTVATSCGTSAACVATISLAQRLEGARSKR